MTASLPLLHRANSFASKWTIASILIIGAWGCDSGGPSGSGGASGQSGTQTTPDIFFVPDDVDDFRFSDKVDRTKLPRPVGPDGPSVVYRLKPGVSVTAYLQALADYLTRRGWYALSHDLMIVDRPAGWRLMTFGTNQEILLWSQCWVKKDCGPLLISVSALTGDAEKLDDGPGAMVRMNQYEPDQTTLMLQGYQRLHGLPWDESATRPASQASGER